MSRFIVVLGSFLGVFVLYLFYGYVLVPGALPVRREHKEQIAQATEFVSEEQGRFAELFPPDAWERTSDDLHVVETPDSFFLYRKSEIISSTEINVSPCTILFLAGGTETPREERLRQAIVIRTPESANLEIDGNLENLAVARFSKIKRGTLRGQVTISSDMQQRGPADDLTILTKEIVFEDTIGKTRIATYEDVDFRLGPHRGLGKFLTIDLAQQNPQDPNSPKVLNNVEFAPLRELHLVFEGPIDTALVSGASSKSEKNKEPAKGSGKKTSVSEPSKETTMIDIFSKKSFVLLPAPGKPNHWIARFNEQVRVVCRHPNGTVDTIEGDQLELDLRPKEGVYPAAEAGASRSFANLEIAQMVVVGKPAKLSSPSHEDFVARGEGIQYDLKSNVILIFNNTPEAAPVFLTARQGEMRMTAKKNISYSLGKEGRIGRLIAEGPGELHGLTQPSSQVPSKSDASKTSVSPGPPKKITCSWNSLDARPDPRNPSQLLITLDRNVRIDYEDVGRMNADAAFFWCLERPKPPASSPNGSLQQKTGSKSSNQSRQVDYIPDRAQIIGNVLFQNESGTCRVKQMDLFFLEAAGETSVYHSTPLPLSIGDRLHKVPAPALLPLPGYPVMPENPIRQVQYQTHSPLPATPFDPAQHSRPNLAQIPQLRPLQYPQPAPAVPSPPMASSAQAAASPVTAFTTAEKTTTKPERPFLFGKSTEKQQSVYEVVGEEMSMRIRTGPKSEIEKLRIAGNVRIIEKILLGNPNDAVDIRCKELHLWEPEGEATEIKMVGEPARPAVFRGKGVELQGMNICLSRPTNTLWIDGVGRLIALLPGEKAAMPGLPTTAPAAKSTSSSGSEEKLVVEWNKGMHFNGKTLQFEGTTDILGRGLKVFYRFQRIYADRIDLHLESFFSFFDEHSVPPKAEILDCSGKIDVLSYQYTLQGHPKSKDEALCERMIYRIASGDFIALGPGVLRSTFPSTSSPLSGELAPDAPKTDLAFLSVSFQDQVVGNYYTSVVNLFGQIDCIYFPIKTWEEKVDTDNMNKILKTGFQMRCNMLEVVQVHDPAQEKGFFMLTARENTRIDGNGYVANAETIKYNQEKELVILEGNGVSKARLYIDQNREGIPASWLEYNLRTKAWRTNGLEGVGFSP